MKVFCTWRCVGYPEILMDSAWHLTVGSSPSCVQFKNKVFFNWNEVTVYSFLHLLSTWLLWGLSPLCWLLVDSFLRKYSIPPLEEYVLRSFLFSWLARYVDRYPVISLPFLPHDDWSWCLFHTHLYSEFLGILLPRF